MVFTTSEDPKPAGIFLLEMAGLLVGPPVFFGLGLAVVAGLEALLSGAVIGLIVGAGAAKLRNEVRGARIGQ